MKTTTQNYKCAKAECDLQVFRSFSLSKVANRCTLKVPANVSERDQGAEKWENRKNVRENHGKKGKSVGEKGRKNNGDNNKQFSGKSPKKTIRKQTNILKRPDRLFISNNLHCQNNKHQKFE